MVSFQGFQPHDFNTDVRGTHWRHRQGLGADLRLRLRKTYGRRYQTWGQPGSNVLHIARRAVYRFPAQESQAFLFVSAGPQHLYWGLSLPVGGDAWQPLLARLNSGDETLPHLLYLLSAYRLTLTDTSSASGGALGGCWHYDRGELIWREACSLPRPVLAHDIPYRLQALSGPPPLASLSLYAAAESEHVLAWGRATAEHLLPVLSALVPLYELCVSLS